MRDQSEQNQVCMFPPGHFYSPIPSIDYLIKNENKIWVDNKNDIPGIDLCTNEQLVLLKKLLPFYKEIPFTENKTEQLRYFYANNYYSYADAVFLYCMIRHTKPKRIIEIGSGYSSCLLLDTNELFFNNSIKIHCIEPYPQILKRLLKPADSSLTKISEQNVQDIPLNLFSELEGDDILFIDSTHISKTGSDVNYVIHEILPILSPGVYIHFHDVFYPFEYPKEWLLAGIAWNEQYILRAFLQYNSHFKIVLFNTQLKTMFREHLGKLFPLAFKDSPWLLKNNGGSIWIKKIKK